MGGTLIKNEQPTTYNYVCEGRALRDAEARAFTLALYCINIE